MSGTFVIAGNRYLNRNRNVECAGPSGNPRGYSVMNSVGPSGTEFFFVGLDGTNNNDGLISDSDTGANLNINTMINITLIIDCYTHTYMYLLE